MIRARNKKGQAICETGRMIAGMEKAHSKEGYIYKLYQDEECIYVGQTTGLARRIRNHIEQGQKIFNSVKCEIFKNELLNEMEAMAICKLTPKHNKTMPTNSKFKRVEVASDVFLGVLIESGALQSVKMNAHYVKEYVDIDIVKSMAEEFSKWIVADGRLYSPRREHEALK